MLGEITHLQGIIDDLVVLTADPHKLPTASEQVEKHKNHGPYSSEPAPPSHRRDLQRPGGAHLPAPIQLLFIRIWGLKLHVRHALRSENRIRSASRT